MPAAGGKNEGSLRAVRSSRGDWDSTVGVRWGLQDTLRSSDSWGDGGVWGTRELDFIAFRFCLGPSLLPAAPGPSSSLKGRAGETEPSPPLRSPPPAPVTAPVSQAGRWAARGLSWCILPLPPPHPLSPATPSRRAPINLPPPGLRSWPGRPVPRQSRSTVEGGGKMWTNF